MKQVIISGIGVEIPEASITQRRTGRQLQRLGRQRERARARGTGEPLLQKSDTDFIVYASGVKTRHVIERDGILDPDAHGAAHPAARPTTNCRSRPSSAWRRRSKALDHAGLNGSDIDMVICAASHQQRPYPAMAIEIQNELGAAARPST